MILIVCFAVENRRKRVYCAPATSYRSINDLRVIIPPSSSCLSARYALKLHDVATFACLCWLHLPFPKFFNSPFCICSRLSLPSQKFNLFCGCDRRLLAKMPTADPLAILHAHVSRRITVGPTAASPRCYFEGDRMAPRADAGGVEPG